MIMVVVTVVVVVVVVVVVTAVVVKICRHMVPALMRGVMVTVVHISRRWSCAGVAEVIHIKDRSDFSDCMG